MNGYAGQPIDGVRLTDDGITVEWGKTERGLSYDNLTIDDPEIWKGLLKVAQAGYERTVQP